MDSRIINAVLLSLLLAASSCGDVATSDYKPETNNTYDIGTSALQWQDLYLSGSLYFDGVATSSYIQGLMNDTTAVATQQTLGLYRNQVTIVRTGTWIWTAYYPDGTSSTCTYTGATDGSGGDLVQTALDYASDNQLGVYITGGSELWGGSTLNIINCTSTLRFPPMLMMTVVMDGITLNFTGALGADPGVWIDNIVQSNLYMPCSQIVYAGTGDAVLIKPMGLNGQGCGVSDILISVVFTTTGRCGVHIDTSECSFSNANIVKINEINGGDYPFLLDKDSGSNLAAFNTFELGYLHIDSGEDVNNAMVSIVGGVSTGNRWTFNDISPKGNSIQGGIKTDGNRDIFTGNILCTGAAAHTAIVVDTNGWQNQFIMGRLEVGAAGTVWTDNSTTQDNYLLTGNTIASNVRLLKTLIFEGTTADAYEGILTTTDITGSDKTWTTPNVTGTFLLDTSAVRTSQQYVQTIAYAKLGATGAGWVIGAADNVCLVTLPQSLSGEVLIVPVTVPLKVGYTITAFSLNGHIDSAGNTVTVDADLRKHTEATAGYADASIGAITQISKTADYKIIDSKTGLAEVVASDESYYIKITATTGATCDVEIASVTITVSEL
jgi:hypothetical protein